MKLRRPGSSHPHARVALAAVFCAAALHAARAARTCAQNEDPATVAAARGLAIEGVKLAQSGRCDAAIDKLERAESLHHAPIVLEQLAECQIELGRLVQGTELLRALLREPIPARPAKTLLRAYVRARQVLEATKPRIATVTVALRGVDLERAVVTFDGQPLPPALIGAARPTDPGEHMVVATARGFVPVEQRVTLAPGEARSLWLELEPEPAVADARAADAAPPASSDPGAAPRVAANAIAPREAPAPARAPSPTARTAQGHTLAYASWTLAAVGIGIGTGFGLAALDAKAELDARCPGGACPASERERLDDAKRAGAISTIAFGAGAACAALGTVLFFTASSADDGERNPNRVAGRLGSARLAPRLRVGPARAELTIAF